MKNSKFYLIFISNFFIPSIFGQWNGPSPYRGNANSFGAGRWTIPGFENKIFPKLLFFPYFGFDEDDDFGGNYGSSNNLNGQSVFRQKNVGSFSNVVNRPPIIFQSNSMPTAALIFFHGMGDQGEGWAQTFQSDFAPNLRQMKFICPNAKSTEEGMTQWFEYQGLDPSALEDLEGLNAVKNYAHYLIDAEIARGIPANRIFLGGFSQGGPVALYAGLSYPEALGGILCLSGFLLPKDVLPNQIRQIPWLNPANMGIPIFIGHGQEDPNVPFSIALSTANALRRFDSNVQFRSYQMGHSTCPAEIGDILRFIQANAPTNFKK